MERDPAPWARRCGTAAFWLGVAYAAVSAYWALGGTAGLDTLGGELERMAHERDAGFIAIVWVTVLLKIIAALLGPALTRGRTPRLPRRPLLVLGWAAAGILTLYGGTLVLAQALVEAGIVDASADTDRKALRWHLYLWDPWFLVWGLLLGAAAWDCTRRTRPRVK